MLVEKNNSVWTDSIAIALALMFFGSLVWLAYIGTKSKAEERRITEYVVTYYPASGVVKTYDPVTKLYRHGKGANFIYNGKEIELIGNVEVIKK